MPLHDDTLRLMFPPSESPTRLRLGKNPVRATPRTREAGRRYRLRAKYGLTPTQYDELLRKQDGGCAICGRSEGVRLGVDHDHTDGSVRGILCQRCNTGIGCFEDSPDRLAKALTYLIPE